MNLSAPRPRNDPRLPIALIACSAVAITIGCGSVTVPKTPFGKPKSSPYADATSGFEGDPRLAQRLYQATRTAASQNSLVLQVVGDADPARILPLPPAGQTVYVSQLLEQTGVMKRYGGVSATLYRYNTAVIGGTRMAVKMNKDSSSVRPESDYALQPGDRLKVEQFTGSMIGQLLEAAS